MWHCSISQGTSGQSGTSGDPGDGGVPVRSSTHKFPVAFSIKISVQFYVFMKVIYNN